MKKSKTDEQHIINQNIYIERLEKHIGRLGGWAQGGYLVGCSTCDKPFLGDKRAVVCLNCALDTEAKNPTSDTAPVNIRRIFENNKKMCLHSVHLDGCRYCGNWEL
jgi:hypothetical protein